jgi:hypothetical protein
MSRRDRIAKGLLVEPGTDADLAGRDPAWTGGPEFEQLSAKQLGRRRRGPVAGSRRLWVWARAPALWRNVCLIRG